MKIAIYPGSFDPFTNGHLDIVERGCRVFDQVYIAVADNPQKQHVFSVKERMNLVAAATACLQNIQIENFTGLLVDYVRHKNTNTILRGLRAFSDFEYELQLASVNRKLAPKIETVFMMTGEENFYISSRMVKEIAAFGGNVGGMVPKPVDQALKIKFLQKT